MAVARGGVSAIVCGQNKPNKQQSTAYHHNDEGPDFAIGALSFSTPVLARQMGDVGSGKSERSETTTRPKRR
jgi:hypothetical protein